MNPLRHYLIERANKKGIARQRMIREARSEAAKRGVSNEWKRRRKLCQEVLG